LHVSVDVRNTGDRAGDEVVQVYASYKKPLSKHPARWLVGFQRVSLRPGESRTVILPLSIEDLSFWDEKTKQFTLSAGRLVVQVGSSSTDVKLQKELEAKS
jgi:beta-glucosidase